MKSKFLILLIGVVIVLLSTVAIFMTYVYEKPAQNKPLPQKEALSKVITKELPLLENIVKEPVKIEPVIKYVGPRENIPEDAPVAYGFWSFAIPVAGVLSRSGQPLIGEFEWLKENGWKGVVNLRVDGERDEVGDDAKIPGFNELGLNYLHIPLPDGHSPNNEEAEQFLAFVTDPKNQPTHVHCRGGIGRAGTMTVLYRYAVEGWPLNEAIEESRPFKGGISEAQKTWLEKWASEFEPGSHRY
jgi:protein tyrosine phosphatase (PTP) superfamily phosphohydrolase (DUF442 family)